MKCRANNQKSVFVFSGQAFLRSIAFIALARIQFVFDLFKEVLLTLPTANEGAVMSMVTLKSLGLNRKHLNHEHPRDFHPYDPS